MRGLVKLLRHRRGASTIEYGILAAFAACVLMSGLSSVGGKLNGVFDKAGQAMAATPAEPAAREFKMEPGPDGRLIHVEDTQDHFLEKHQ